MDVPDDVYLINPTCQPSQSERRRGKWQPGESCKIEKEASNGIWDHTKANLAI